MDEIKLPGFTAGYPNGQHPKGHFKSLYSFNTVGRNIAIKPSGTAGPDLGKLLTMNSDALELLGHATHQLSMHRRQAIIPFLNKQYAALCFPQGPFTEFLFGDELQAQLNNIKATKQDW